MPPKKYKDKWTWVNDTLAAWDEHCQGADHPLARKIVMLVYEQYLLCRLQEDFDEDDFDALNTCIFIRQNLLCASLPAGRSTGVERKERMADLAAAAASAPPVEPDT